MLPIKALLLGAEVAATPIIRGSRLTLVNANPATFTLPPNAAADDSTFILIGNGWQAICPSGWSQLDNQQGSNWNGAIFYKVLTASDISTGTVSISFGGTFNGVIAGVSFIGEVYLRAFVASRNGSGSTSRSLTTDATPQADDLAISFGSVRFNGACSIDLGAQLQAANGSNASGVLNGGALLTGGAKTANYTYPATPTGDYQSIVVVRPPVGEAVPFSFVKFLMFGEGADGSTTFTDHSSIGRAITANGNVQQDTDQDVHGQSILFDGTGDYVSMADAADIQLATSDFCFEAYVYVTSLAHISTLISKMTAGNTGYRFYITTDGKLHMDVLAGGTSRIALTSTNAVPTNQVVHVAITQQGVTGRVFIDGNLEASGNRSADYTAGNATCGIGEDIRLGSRALQGSMNWVRLTVGHPRYIANFTPPSTPLPTS